MKKGFIIAGILLVLMVGTAMAAPVLPEFFYGTAKVNNLPVAGATISAKINGTIVGTTTTATNGSYGITTPQLLVTGNMNGDLITFYINGNQASETAYFLSGGSTSLDLTIGSSPTPTPTPAPCKINQINQGDTVYVGEEGLDITNAVGNISSIAWFEAGDDPITANPKMILPIPSGSKTSYFIAPTQYSGYQGAWYLWSDQINVTRNLMVAFVAVNPVMNITCTDNPNDLDVTDKSVFHGTVLNFKVETNLDAMGSRTTSCPAGVGPFTIYVKSPDGVIYTALASKTGQISLKDFRISNNPYYMVTPGTEQGWYTAAQDTQGMNFQYKMGTYSFWIECNANKLKENNPSGAVSKTHTVELKPEVVSITSSPSSVIRSNPFSLTIQGRPNTWYNFYLKDCPRTLTGGTCDEAPLIAPGQNNVIMDGYNPAFPVYTIGNNMTYPECCFPNSPIKDVVPRKPENGVRYYAYVKTDDSGKAVINMLTTLNTKTTTFTYHAYTRGLDGKIIYTDPDAQVTVTAGSISISMQPSATLGTLNTILIKGVNTETLRTYLWLKGPCQPECGANLSNPSYKLGCPTVVPVSADGTWEYKWSVANLNIDAGEYTIYAATNWYCSTNCTVSNVTDNGYVNPCTPEVPCPIPICRQGGDCNGQCTSNGGSGTTSTCEQSCYCPNQDCKLCTGCAATTQTNITLIKPIISATVTPSVLVRECCNDHTITIQGTATGLHTQCSEVNNTKKIRFWLFGDGKILDIHYLVGDAYVSCNDTFTIKLTKDGSGVDDPGLGLTYVHGFPVDKVKNGRYYMILQHPMYNNRFDIEVLNGGYYDPTRNRKYVVSWCPNILPSFLFPVEGPGAKMDKEMYDGVIEALNADCVDDIYTTLSFYVVDDSGGKVDFSGTPVAGSAPLKVTFTDKSATTANAWSWDFGDGATSTEKNPVHTYETTGIFDVSLNVKFADGTSGYIVKNKYISTMGVTPTPTPYPGYTTIDLYPGWNLASVPLYLKEGQNTASKVFGGVNTAGHSIRKYNGISQAWDSVTASEVIVPLEGYGVYSTSTMSISLSLNTTSGVKPVKQLYTGWNAIGVSGIYPKSARDDLLSVKGLWNQVNGWDASKQQYETAIIAGSQDPETSENRLMYPTHGYWIDMNSDGTLEGVI